MKEFVEELRKFDFHKGLEILTGKRYEEYAQSEKLDFLFEFVLGSEVNLQKLKYIGDTYLYMPWNEFIDIITKYGFVKLKEEFVNTDYDVNNSEKHSIYYTPEIGLMIDAQSYENHDGTKTLYSAWLYGELEIVDFENVANHYNTIRNISPKCFLKEKSIFFETGIIRGFIFKLYALSKIFDFAKQKNDTVNENSKLLMDYIKYHKD